ncbi:MAG: hypothetical protein LBE35_08185 [Clostridiales bacterium]|jgi:hypothetical protein|nr:hypothetical protein [Clostridiales bacterium]
MGKNLGNFVILLVALVALAACNRTAQDTLNITIGDASHAVTPALLAELGRERVAMSDIIRHFNIDLAGISEGVIISGEDGFSQPFSTLELENFYLVFEEAIGFMSIFPNDGRETRNVRGIAEIRLLQGVQGVAAAIEGLADGEIVILQEFDSHTVTMDEIVALGLEDFSVFWTNDPRSDDRMRYFTGVRLSAILSNLGIELTGAETLITTSWESEFQAVWTAEDALNVIFVVVGEDGEPLDERHGPFFAVAVGRAPNFAPRNLQSIRIN